MRPPLAVATEAERLRSQADRIACAPDPELRQLVAFLYPAYPQDAGRIISKQKRGARRAGE